MSGFYGGGFEDNNGGGYDTSAAGNGSQGMGSPGSDRKADTRADQNLVPVTIKQVHEATDIAKDEFTIDGRSVHHVKIIGAIRDIEERSSHVQYTVEDGTGSITVRKWLDMEGEASTIERSAFAKGKYVRVIGQLREQQPGSRNIVAYSLAEVTDFNQVTHHFLEAMHAFAVASGASGQGATHQPSFVSHAAPTEGKSLLAQQPQGQYEQGLTTTQQAIVNLFKQEQDNLDDLGMDIKVITQKLVPTHSPNDIQKAVAQLAEDGHIYSTVDDNHYMVT